MTALRALVALVALLLFPVALHAQDIRITQTPVEVVIDQDPTVRVTQVVVEVVLLEGSPARFSPVILSRAARPAPAEARVSWHHAHGRNRDFLAGWRRDQHWIHAGIEQGGAVEGGGEHAYPLIARGPRHPWRQVLERR